MFVAELCAECDWVVKKRCVLANCSGEQKIELCFLMSPNLLEDVAQSDSFWMAERKLVFKAMLLCIIQTLLFAFVPLWRGSNSFTAGCFSAPTPFFSVIFVEVPFFIHTVFSRSQASLCYTEYASERYYMRGVSGGCENSLGLEGGDVDIVGKA